MNYLRTLVRCLIGLEARISRSRGESQKGDDVLRRFMVTGITLLSLILSTGCSEKRETIKIGFLDPLSGPFALVGEHILREVQLFADAINARGGVLGGKELEIIAFDGKGNPQESLIAFKQLVDQDISFMLQGNSSAVANALTEAVLKHNQRNRNDRVLYLNYGAVDPALTNDRCNFWHFRFDADATMKMRAITAHIANDSGVNKVYLLNQDYGFGHAISSLSRDMLGTLRPDIAIVGDDFHPLAKIKDFAPYVSKIRSSGADTVITGNWGSDLSLLVRAAKEAGLDVTFYTQYAGIVGAISAMGEAAEGKVKQVSGWHVNAGGGVSDQLASAYLERFPEARDDLFFISTMHALEMLVRSIDAANTTEVQEVARQLETMTYEGPTGVVSMRADNHQLSQPLYISTFVNVEDEGLSFDIESTGIGPKTDAIVAAEALNTPTTCEMERP